MSSNLQNLTSPYLTKNERRKEGTEEERRKILSDVTQVTRESIWSFLSNKTIEEGLGQIQFYNVSVTFSRLNTPSSNEMNGRDEMNGEERGEILVRISGNLPEQGLSIPLIDYIEEIGVSEFDKMIQDLLIENINKESKTNISVRPDIKITVHKFDIDVNVHLYFRSKLDQIPEKVQVRKPDIIAP